MNYHSGDLSLMLPSEYSLFASTLRGPQLLHKARHVERTLFSYERSGWVEDSAVTRRGTEVRPASQCGPLLLCLDTSGSMQGSREKVAKAIAVEALRQAKSQNRPCMLYSFSGPNEVQELELTSLPPLLDFISHSFHGGTDLVKPLDLALERLDQEVWNNSDILLVSDGEVPMPKQEVVDKLDHAKQDMELRVHGILVGAENSHYKTMDYICTSLSHFSASARPTPSASSAKSSASRTSLSHF